MNQGRGSLLTSLSVTSLLLALSSSLSAAEVHHFAISAIASPQHMEVPISVTLSAMDSNNLLVTNFSGPVQLFFTNNTPPPLLETFSDGTQFDTDGDGVADGASRLMAADMAYLWLPGLNLVSNKLYSISADMAVDPGDKTVFFGPDGVLYPDPYHPVQVVNNWGWWVQSNHIARFTGQSEFYAPADGVFTLLLRYWIPIGGSAVVYTDNVKVRVRDVSPSLVFFQQGQWTGEVTPFEVGSNLVLRALNNGGISGDSQAFDVLPPAADASVKLLDNGPLPANQPATINFVVSNAGPSNIEGVAVTNQFSGNFELIGTVPAGGLRISSNLVVTLLPPIPRRTSIAYSMVLKSSRAGEFDISAILATPDYATAPSNDIAMGTVTFVPTLTCSNSTVTETPGGTNAIFTFTLSTPGLQDIAVDYLVRAVSANPGTDFLLPPAGALFFPAGATQQVLSIPVLDDIMDEAAEQFMVTLSITNGAPVWLDATNYAATIVDDDPLPTLTLTLPQSAMETSGTLTNAGQLSMSAPFEQDIQITFTSSDPTELLAPAPIVVSAGSTTASLTLPVVDDSVFDLPQVVTITAQCTNGMVASTQITILNDEPPYLTLTLTGLLIEGVGNLTNALRVSSPEPLASNLVVTLACSDTTELMVPTNVLLLAGETFTNVSVTVLDDAETDGPQRVTISATAPGFTPASRTITVYDNDVHHFSIRPYFGGTFTPKTSTVPFPITVAALDISNITIQTFTQAVALTAQGDLGVMALTPTNTPPFFWGSWAGNVTITNGLNFNVRITATDTAGHTGQSDPFTVYAPASQITRILGASKEGSDVRIQFTTLGGRHYRVETATGLLTNWSVVVPDVLGTGAPVTVMHTNGALLDARFYRVALQAPP